MRQNPPVKSALRFDGENSTYNYVGEAPIGAATSASNWRIYRLTNTGTASLIKQWADGNDAFDNVWDDRASLSYS